MSDRTMIIQLKALPNYLGEATGIDVFMDGESGTWRLFLNPSLMCVDLSLEMLRDLHNQIGESLKKIEDEPNEYNAEERKNWVTL